MTTSMKQVRGFTVIELIVVVTIAGVLITLAVPNLRDVIRNSQITGATNELVASLNLARSEALKRHALVRVCAAPTASDAANPTDALCEASDDWSEGWMIIAQNISGTGPDWIPVRISNPVGAVNITTDSPVTDTFQISFDAQGRQMNGALTTFSVCDDRDDSEKYGRQITVAQSGLLKAGKIPESDSCL